MYTQSGETSTKLEMDEWTVIGAIEMNLGIRTF